MQEDNCFQIEDNIPDTQFFIFKNKLYPIKLNILQDISEIINICLKVRKIFH